MDYWTQCGYRRKRGSDYFCRTRVARRLYYGTGASAIGLIGFIFNPISVFRDHEILNQKIANASTPDEQSKALQEAEFYLERDSDNQKQGIGWLNQSINVAFNMAAGLPLGIFYDRWVSAITSIGAGIVLGEAIILTQPTSIFEAQNKYKAGHYNLLQLYRQLSLCNQSLRKAPMVLCYELIFK